MKAKIKEQNYRMLRDISSRGIEARTEVQGNKLQAIFRLIQKRGEPIQSNNNKYHGLKALEFGAGEYIAMQRTGPTDKFYPCAIRTILLTTIN